MFALVSRVVARFGCLGRGSFSSQRCKNPGWKFGNEGWGQNISPVCGCVWDCAALVHVQASYWLCSTLHTWHLESSEEGWKQHWWSLLNWFCVVGFFFLSLLMHHIFLQGLIHHLCNFPESMFFFPYLKKTQMCMNHISDLPSQSKFSLCGEQVIGFWWETSAVTNYCILMSLNIEKVFFCFSF